MKSPLFLSAILTTIIVCTIELISFYFHLFYSIMWFDMIMHFSGGFLVALLALTIVTYYKQDLSYGQILFWGIITAFLIGVLWEVYELYEGITVWGSFGYWGDNGMDVTMDTFGGLVAVWYSYIRLHSYNSKKLHA
jgi:hypothetical protein